MTSALCCLLIVGCRGEKNKSDTNSTTNSSQPSTITPETLAPLPETSPPLGNPTHQTVQEPTRPAAAQPRQRAPDDRMVINQQRVAGTGIKRFEARRLLLYTDVDTEQAARLSRIADGLFNHLTKYFGPLPPAADGSEFQATGYLMKTPATFRARGLFPERVPQFENGRHLGYEFWLYDQKQDYYRRHLLLHEFVHTFMASVTGTQDAPPAWYMEGMAEYFATHRISSGTVTFAVMPEQKSGYEGLGRITFLNAARDRSDIKTASEVMLLRADDPALYPWSWALCWFLAEHPQTSDSFREIGTHLTRAEFAQKLDGILQGFKPLEHEWHWFLQQLCDGIDLKRGATRFAAGVPLAAGEQHNVAVQADRGWQSTSIQLDAAGTYTITASGRVQVDDEPRPWMSEAQGVSARYVDDERLGCLMAAVYRPDDTRSLGQSMRIGQRRELSGQNGTLYLRVNDAMNALADNAGAYSVTITRER